MKSTRNWLYDRLQVKSFHVFAAIVGQTQLLKSALSFSPGFSPAVTSRILL
jgi:hypothetical protein